jgi:hypothetical protein
MAMHGFDLRSRLNGRAIGDGVYSSTNANTALGYSSGRGALLQMQGLVTAQETTISNEIYVFRCTPSYQW